MADRPNVIYLHSHDTGRHVQPYGHAVPTPAIQRLAEEGVLFRRAFATAATCSGSRAALVTGQYPHVNGMTGLAHRGWELNDNRQHLVHTLRRPATSPSSSASSTCPPPPTSSGYDRFHEIDSNHVATVAPLAVGALEGGLPEPFFLSVGFFETHRRFFEPTSPHDERYALPPEHLPDLPEVRRDMAHFLASARSLDGGVQQVLAALERTGLDERTLVILTTDHGLPFPGAKATLFDRGLGVSLILRGPGGFRGGRVQDAMVSHLDLFPTLCDLAGLQHPEYLQGSSLLPLAAARSTACTTSSSRRSPITPPTSPSARCGPTATSSSAGSTPPRARPPEHRRRPVQGRARRLGWYGWATEEERLHDVLLDPGEGRNLIARSRLRRRSRATCARGCTAGWRRPTTRSCAGPVPLPPRGRANGRAGAVGRRAAHAAGLRAARRGSRRLARPF